MARLNKNIIILGIVIALFLYIFSGQRDQRIQLQERLGPATIIQGFTIQSCQGNSRMEESNRNVSCSECLQIPTGLNETTIYKSVCTPKGKPTVEEAKIFLCEDFKNCGNKIINNIQKTISFGRQEPVTQTDKLSNGFFTLGISIFAGIIIAFLTGSIGIPFMLAGLIISSLFIAGSTQVMQQSIITEGNKKIDINELSKTCYATQKNNADWKTIDGIHAIQDSCTSQVCSSLIETNKMKCILEVKANVLSLSESDLRNTFLSPEG